MSLSASYDFSVNRNELITQAYRSIGMVAKGDDPSANEIADAAKTLNMMIKAGQGPPNYWCKGLKMWKRERVSLTLDATKNSYSLKSSGGDCDTEIPIHILTAVRRNSDDQDDPLTPITLEEYEGIADKTASGTPTEFYYERRLTEGKFYIDCKPSDVTDTIEMVVVNPMNDMDAAANDFDFPSEWMEALKYNLAVRLATDNGIPVSGDLDGLAQAGVAQANSFEQEESNVYFEPGRDD